MSFRYKHASKFRVSAETLFSWHEQPSAFEALSPPWLDVRIVEKSAGLQDGARVVLDIGKGPIRLRWALRHQDYIRGVQFKDVQTSGPFASWTHTHKFATAESGGSVLEDLIECDLPVPVPFAGLFLKKELDRMFTYRQQVIESSFHSGQIEPMNIIVSGSHGLVGQALLPSLAVGGHRVLRLVRGKAGGSTDIGWDPDAGVIDSSGLVGADAVVHLAGESIASGRWNEAKKKRLRDSRVVGTRLLCEALAKMENPPKVLVCASAIGFYGETGSEVVDESHGAGKSFLASVCQEWEAACEPARARGIRVVNLRFGVILSPKGGALAMMLLPFQMGAGGIIGNGRQYMSWLAIDDAVGAITHAITNSALVGAVNTVAPNPVTNHDYTKTLGKVLGRPTIFPVPAFAAKAAFGEMADELLLASCRVKPAKLEATGYHFKYPQLEGALRHILGK